VSYSSGTYQEDKKIGWERCDNGLVAISYYRLKPFRSLWRNMMLVVAADWAQERHRAPMINVPIR